MHEVSNSPGSAAGRWRVHVTEHHRSGQSVRDYCALHGLKTPTFYDWRRRLAATVRPAFVSVQVTRPPAAAFEAAGVELILASGDRLRLARGFDPDVLCAAVAALEAARRC